jgi:hypothetical protein
MNETSAGRLNELVREFLAYHGYTSSLSAFAEEEGRVRESDHDGAAEVVAKQAQDAFDSGKRAAFFALWSTRVTPRSAENMELDVEEKRLLFYSHVYFAMFPLFSEQRRDSEDLSSRMEQFKRFLDTDGATLATTAEFIPFYALPYVPHPQDHPSFSHLLLDSWRQNLKTDILAFIKRVVTVSADPFLTRPTLYHIIEEAATHSAAPAEISEYTTKLTALGELCGEMLSTISAGQADGAKIARWEQRLEQVSPEHAAGIFSVPIVRKSLSRPSSANTLRQSLNKSLMSTLKAADGRAVLQPTLTPAPLDFSKVRKELESHNKHGCAPLLHALRWRLRSCIGEGRRCVLQTYVQADIFGCKLCANGKMHESTLALLLREKSRSVAEEAVRLMNVMCIELAGRQYLRMSPDVVQSVFGLVAISTPGSVAWKNGVAALQKLSVKAPEQAMLFHDGVCDWICKTLLDADNLCDYSLEYITALAMKLALATKGRTHFAQVTIGGGTISVLNALIESENPQIRTYVNGALYALLQHPVLKEQAHALGFEELLSCLVTVSEPNVARQFRYILQQLQAPALPEEEDNDDFEEDTADESMLDLDNDDMAEEDDEHEETLDETGPTREELLCQKYLAPTAAARKSAVAAAPSTRPIKSPVSRPVSHVAHRAGLHTSGEQGKENRPSPKDNRPRPRTPPTEQHKDIFHAPVPECLFALALFHPRVPVCS